MKEPLRTKVPKKTAECLRIREREGLEGKTSGGESRRLNN